MKFGRFVAALCVASTCFAAPPATKPSRVVDVKLVDGANEQTQKAFAALMRQRDASRAQAQNDLNAAKAEVAEARSRKRFADIRSAMAKQKQAEARVADVSRGDYLPAPESNLPINYDTGRAQIAAGWYGYLNTVRVRQVVDQNTVLATAIIRLPVQGEEWMPVLECAIGGIDTSGIVDGQILRMDSPAVAVPFAFAATDGSKRTVLRFDKIDWSTVIVKVYEDAPSGQQN